jgi:hypothetical protein
MNHVMMVVRLQELDVRTAKQPQLGLAVPYIIWHEQSNLDPLF